MLAKIKTRVNKLRAELYRAQDELGFCVHVASTRRVGRMRKWKLFSFKLHILLHSTLGASSAFVFLFFFLASDSFSNFKFSVLNWSEAQSFWFRADARTRCSCLLDCKLILCYSGSVSCFCWLSFDKERSKELKLIFRPQSDAFVLTGRAGRVEFFHPLQLPTPSASIWSNVNLLCLTNWTNNRVNPTDRKKLEAHSSISHPPNFFLNDWAFELSVNYRRAPVARLKPAKPKKCTSMWTDSEVNWVESGAEKRWTGNIRSGSLGFSLVGGVCWVATSWSVVEDWGWSQEISSFCLQKLSCWKAQKSFGMDKSSTWHKRLTNPPSKRPLTQ